MLAVIKSDILREIAALACFENSRQIKVSPTDSVVIAMQITWCDFINWSSIEDHQMRLMANLNDHCLLQSESDSVPVQLAQWCWNDSSRLQIWRKKLGMNDPLDQSQESISSWDSQESRLKFKLNCSIIELHFMEMEMDSLWPPSLWRQKMSFFSKNYYPIRLFVGITPSYCMNWLNEIGNDTLGSKTKAKDLDSARNKAIFFNRNQFCSTYSTKFKIYKKLFNNAILRLIQTQVATEKPNEWKNMLGCVQK